LNDLPTGFYVGKFHPLTMLSLAIEYAFVGQNPWLYHFNNLCLHVLNSGLAYQLILRFNKNTWVAFLTTLFFAIDPLHVESVAWAAEREDVLYRLFLLLSFLSYLTFAEKKIKFQYGLSYLFLHFRVFQKAWRRFYRPN